MTHEEDDALRAALAEVVALRAALGRHGLDRPVGEEPGDRRSAAEDDAAIARILGAGSGAVPASGARPAAAPSPSGPRAGSAVPAPGAPVADGARGPGRADVGPAVGGVADLDRRRARGRRGWYVVAGAAAAVLVAIGGTVLASRTPPVAYADGSPPMLAYPIAPADLAAGDGEPARDALLALAGTAAQHVDPEPAGEVQHLLSQSWLLQSESRRGPARSTTVDPTVAESWLEPDGALASVEWRGSHLGADGRLAGVGTSPADATVDRFPAGTFDAQQVAELPLDPTELRVALLAPLAEVGCGAQAASEGGAWCLYQAVSALADRYVLPSDLESAMWTVLADEPGVRLAGEVVDRAGRTSIAITIPGGSNDLDPMVRVLLVDEATGRLSGVEEVTLSSAMLGLAEPTVTHFRYEVASDWVADVGGPGTVH